MIPPLQLPAFRVVSASSEMHALYCVLWPATLPSTRKGRVPVTQHMDMRIVDSLWTCNEPGCVATSAGRYAPYVAGNVRNRLPESGARPLLSGTGAGAEVAGTHRMR